MGLCRGAGSTQSLMQLQIALWQHCLSLSVAAFSGLWHIPLISYFGNISQDKRASAQSSASRGPEVRNNYAGFIRGWKDFWKQHTHTHTHTHNFKMLVQQHSVIYFCKNPLSICSFYMLFSCIYLLIYKNWHDGCDIKLRHTVTFSVCCRLTKIWIHKQPTGAGFAAEHQDMFTLPMCHCGFLRT